MRKVKVVMITSYFDRNGVTSQVINYATNLDKNKFQLSIAAGEPYDIGYEKMCQENNIELCKLPQKHKNAYAYYRTIYSFLKKKKPDIVHVHGSSTLIVAELLIAMLVGVPVRVSHSHNTICSHPLLHQTLKPFLKVVSNCYLACGELAGKWMYGDGVFKIIPNAFETDTFVLNSETRVSIRKKLGVGDNLVIGHIGKFNNQKNQNYLIRAFERLSYKDDKAILLLVGNGPDLEEIRNQAQHTVCADRIIFWGATENPESLYYAMDIFALPSKGIVIYDCMDNHPAFVNDERQMEIIIRQEENLIKKASLVLVSSNHLIDILKSRYGNEIEKKINLVRNGYNGAILDQAKTVSEKKHKLYTFAYFGTISTWFNFDYILRSLEECADIQYELFGPLAGVQIPKHERIHYHGTIEHEKLLENIKDADCLIMPFLINEIIEAVDPVKLYEYINFNKNILTCRYEEIERFEPFVYFYTGYDEFIKQILNLKKSNDVKYSNDDRETFLRENSWKCRVDTIIKTLKRRGNVRE